MNTKKWALFSVFGAFTAYTTYVVIQFGYMSVFELSIKTHSTTQVLIDLVIACTLIISWMYRDGKRHQIFVLPYIVVTLFLGTIGPMMYLIHKEFKKQPKALPEAELQAT